MNANNPGLVLVTMKFQTNAQAKRKHSDFNVTYIVLHFGKSTLWM